jgi:DNA-binding transcriptional LysR family regulator
VALAETGDTAKAGALLNIGPSAVSKRLSKAETELVTKFFRKTKSRAVLTKDGDVYFREASRAIEHAVLAEEKVVAAKRLREGRLSVGHSTYLPSRLLVLLARLNNENIPGMSVEQIGGFNHEIEDAVVNSLLHIGIGFFPVSVQGLSTHLLIEDPIVLCMKAGHPLASKAEIRPEDLEQQPIIAVGRQTFPALHEEIAEFFGGFGVDLNVVADAYAPSEALCLAEQRIGVCLLDRSSTVLSRNIVTKPLFTSALTRKCGIFYREENPHPMIQKFVALIGERIAQAHL